jgi:hypothetical protein
MEYQYGEYMMKRQLLNYFVVTKMSTLCQLR